MNLSTKKIPICKLKTIFNVLSIFVEFYGYFKSLVSPLTCFATNVVIWFKLWNSPTYCSKYNDLIMNHIPLKWKIIQKYLVPSHSYSLPIINSYFYDKVIFLFIRFAKNKIIYYFYSFNRRRRDSLALLLFDVYFQRILKSRDCQKITSLVVIDTIDRFFVKVFYILKC